MPYVEKIERTCEITYLYLGFCFEIIFFEFELITFKPELFRIGFISADNIAVDLEVRNELLFPLYHFIVYFVDQGHNKGEIVGGGTVEFRALNRAGANA